MITQQRPIVFVLRLDLGAACEVMVRIHNPLILNGKGTQSLSYVEGEKGKGVEDGVFLCPFIDQTWRVQDVEKDIEPEGRRLLQRSEQVRPDAGNGMRDGAENSVKGNCNS